MEDNGRAAGSNSLNFRPVNPEESGAGLPYAPENFPNEGDIWRWRSGRRITPTGMFQDRYLYLPDRMKRAGNAGSSSKQKHIFASKLAVERYIKANFPDADIKAFFASFTWRIPAVPGATANGMPIAAVPLQQIPLAEEPNADAGVVKCMAGNKMCDSLIPEELEKYLPAPCDICCTEPGFCRDCTCILCAKTVSPDHGDYGSIKCLVNTREGTCCHVAHLECSIQARMAGTVGGSNGLDAEYLCRRCDGRTDLISHVYKLLQTCDAVDLDEEIQKKILNLGACLLRGSQKADAKELMKHIELGITKLASIPLFSLLRKSSASTYFGTVTMSSPSTTEAAARSGLVDSGKRNRHILRSSWSRNPVSLRRILVTLTPG